MGAALTVSNALAAVVHGKAPGRGWGLRTRHHAADRKCRRRGTSLRLKVAVKTRNTDGPGRRGILAVLQAHRTGSRSPAGARLVLSPLPGEAVVLDGADLVSLGGLAIRLRQLVQRLSPLPARVVDGRDGQRPISAEDSIDEVREYVVVEGIRPVVQQLAQPDHRPLLVLEHVGPRVRPQV